MNQQDPLQQLWQSQPTSSIDIQAIKRRMLNLRLKHWAYMLLDICGLIAVIAVLWFAQNEFHPVLKAGLLVLLLATAIMTAYLLWLRRHALFLHTMNTDMYVEKLKLQLANNVRIAWVTKHSTWIIAIFLVLMWIGIGAYGDLSPDDYYRRLGIVLASLAVLMPLLWWWAAKREKRFQNELHALNQHLKDD